MRWLLVCLAIAGCARAGKENSIIGGVGDAGPPTDADEVPEPDASPIDAPPQQVTLRETTSGAISVGNSFACAVRATRFTLENSYYRVFSLADFQITSTLHVTQVEFGIQTAAAGGGAQTQPATLHLGTYGVTPQGDTLELAQIRPLSSASIQIPNGSATRMTVPITGDIPPTTSVIVELAIPDGTAVGNQFFIGTNTQGERKPGYTRGPDCGFTSPTSMQSIADDLMLGNVHMVLTVTGQTTSTPD